MNQASNNKMVLVRFLDGSSVNYFRNMVFAYFDLVCLFGRRAIGLVGITKTLKSTEPRIFLCFTNTLKPLALNHYAQAHSQISKRTKAQF